MTVPCVRACMQYAIRKKDTVGASVEITHCSICPFAQGDGAEWCGADKKSRSTYAVDVDKTSPSWCPIRETGVTVIFKETP